jgi:hypothetical protein
MVPVSRQHNHISADLVSLNARAEWIVTVSRLVVGELPNSLGADASGEPVTSLVAFRHAPGITNERRRTVRCMRPTSRTATPESLLQGVGTIT